MWLNRGERRGYEEGYWRSWCNALYAVKIGEAAIDKPPVEDTGERKAYPVTAYAPSEQERHTDKIASTTTSTSRATLFSGGPSAATEGRGRGYRCFTCDTEVAPTTIGGERMQQDLEQRLRDLEAIAEQYYPEQVQELARRLHEETDVVEAKIDHLVRTRNQSKFVILDMVLSYHRMADRW